MKKIIFILSILCITSSLSTATQIDKIDNKTLIVKNQDKPITQLPVAVPNVGGNVKIFAQNVRNYFFTLSNEQFLDRSDCKDQACFAEKTHDLVDVFRFVDADIYALNEMEATNEAVAQLVDSLNIQHKNTIYAYVQDNANWEEGLIKSAFIYRNDRIQPIGNNTAASTQFAYRNQMRVQAFEHIETGVKFVVSANHFKAKDNTADQGNEKRETNANSLVSALNSFANNYSKILIVGDLNCEIGESPITILQNAGYENLLPENEYSHCYGGGELIDHAMANANMQTCVTGATVYHISTTCSYNGNNDYQYSDHDPYLVGLQFEKEAEKPCETLNFSETFYSSLGQFESINISGTNDWYCDYNYHYAKMNGTASNNNEDWLVSPSFDLDGYSDAALTFDHTANKGNVSNKTNMQTLWVSSDYTGIPSAATWTQLTIPNYPAGTNWTFVNSGKITIPQQFLTNNMHFAFKYVAATTAEASCWEIKNVQLTANCVASAIETTIENQPQIFARDGRIFGAENARIYDVLGRDVTKDNGSLKGVFVVKTENAAQKIVVK